MEPLIKKNSYLKPEVYQVNIEPVSLITASFPVDREDYGEAEVVMRRGEWGNLWNAK